jgi:hypothetical protein
MGNAITFGSELVFNRDITPYCSATTLDATHFAVAYKDDGNDEYGTAIVGEVDLSIDNIWSGEASNAWNNTGNWLGGFIPGGGDDVVIPIGLSNYPTLAAAGQCNNITLLSNALLTATLLDNGFLTINGTTYVERFFTGNDLGWHLVSSPLSDATAGVFSGMFMQSFNEPDYVWSDIIDPNASLDVMDGYALYSTLGATNTATFTGILNTGPQSEALVTGPDSYNWNLVGNPYASSIDWEAVTIPAGMSNEMHYLNAATGGFLSYVQGTGGSGSRYIPPMQGFFVSTASATTLAFTDAVRTHTGSGIFYKSYNPNLIVLQAEGENFSDEAWIHFNENAGVEHDGTYDAYKRISLINPELPQLFSITPSGDYLSVNGLPNTDLISIGFTAANSGEFTIKALETGNFAELVLEDLFTFEQTDLLSQSYTFGHNEGDQVYRFQLHMLLTGIDQNIEDGTRIYTGGKSIHVFIPDSRDARIAIYNIMGQQLMQSVLRNGLNSFNPYSTGAYVVKIAGDSQLTTKKVIVK